ncbi:Ppx/GppA family phosphatase [Sphingomonas donggukensis]|uniref:Ppx/GppA family phosphatase n=1 Tax=Sphingomonas donggukensis TaxID=2949093 RepID=A0ABY4TS01_9SPHN|nr:Ppx/GppA phosphatase family protein [Sphingomonas donggukensis]URW75037.1 Ppx/GppA family phosphatase [Sphingomonas donggukensis]
MGDRPARAPFGPRREAPRPARQPSGPPASGASATGAAAPAPVARGRWPQARHYAALDLGTNNCRLLIARPQGSGFAVVDAFSRIVRLGEGLAATGRLSDEAIERTIAALRVCADKLKRRDVALARSVATEACRRASNGQAFIERAYRETGIMLDIISAEEEARLAVLGCHALIEPGDGAALVFDIGGGSTELVLVDTRPAIPTILDWHSAPWGVVSLTEHVGAGGPETYDAMRNVVRDSFAGFAARLPEVGHRRLLGTSGTVTTLASVHLGLASYDRSAIDGLLMPAASMRAVSRRIAALDMAGRSKVACIGPERADLVVAGCAILEEILDIWPAEQLGIADRGIREGILRRLMGTRK